MFWTLEMQPTKRALNFNRNEAFTIALFASVVVGCGEPHEDRLTTSKQSIINGVDIPAEKYSAVGGVFLQTNNGPCTATFIARRCVLSAAHCGPIQAMVLGANAFNPDKNDVVMRTLAHPLFKQRYYDYSHDLELGWVALSHRSDGTSINHEGDYVPIPVNYDQLSMTQEVGIVGYGGKDGAFSEFGLGIKRWGEMMVSSYTAAPDPGEPQPVGYVLTPDGIWASDTRGGDSGGPIVLGEAGTFDHQGAQTYGVLSYGELAGTNPFSFYAATYEPSNASFLQEQLTAFCVPQYLVQVSVNFLGGNGGNEYVTGTVGSDPQPIVCHLGANGSDKCWGRTSGYVSGSVSLTAVPDSNSQFLGWRGLYGQDIECKCNGMTVNPCEFELTEGEDEWGDRNDCVATFGPLP